MAVMYIECPESLTMDHFTEMPDDTKTVFLAGGISGCSDWQTTMVTMLTDASKQRFPAYDSEVGARGMILINPRRSNFDITNPAMSAEQIEWEHKHLQRAHITLFWFPHETLCPITLYELGVAAASNKTIVVGCDPKYQRKFDVEKQLSLIRKNVKVVDNLQELADTVIDLVVTSW